MGSGWCGVFGLVMMMSGVDSGVVMILMGGNSIVVLFVVVLVVGVVLVVVVFVVSVLIVSVGMVSFSMCGKGCVWVLCDVCGVCNWKLVMIESLSDVFYVVLMGCMDIGGMRNGGKCVRCVWVVCVDRCVDSGCCVLWW